MTRISIIVTKDTDDSPKGIIRLLKMYKNCQTFSTDGSEHAKHIVKLIENQK